MGVRRGEGNGNVFVIEMEPRLERPEGGGAVSY